MSSGVWFSKNIMRSLLALLPLASAQDLLLKQEVAKKDAEVLIVGAGWSGMSAAHQLAQHGVSFKIIEAREYTGGRTIPFNLVIHP